MTPAAPSDGTPGTAPQLRADAARNRARILEAARAAFRERGTAAPLDEIARRAGVNIATLYRRFPDGEALIRQVVIDGYAVLLRTAQAAAEEAAVDGAMPALERWLLRLVAEREMLVLPLLGGPVIDDAESRELQREIRGLLQSLLTAAREEGTIRGDVTAADLITTVALACRPLPHLDPEVGRTLAERHVRVFLDGMGPERPGTLPPGPSLDEVLARVNAAGGGTAAK